MSDPPPPYSEKGQNPGYPNLNPESYPSQPGYPQNYTAQVQHNVVIAQPMGYPGGVLKFGRYPLQIKCPNCQADIVTGTTTEIGTFAWCMCVLIACFWLWPFCFIALCIDSLKDVVHTCPNCKKELGRYKRM
ncbi:LITAF domain-containing protein-like [Saccostrea cucullata]|uniref:LITAF domain-containing protein-like n=1 Tax=Saccostrea cuccullata TaxID=36930 RepID=UPI002ED2EFD7